MNEYEVRELSYYLDEVAQDLEQGVVSAAQVVSRLRRKAHALREEMSERSSISPIRAVMLEQEGLL